ncbi:MAG: methyltransferase domain-containing protein [Dokdonella sp.]
MSVDKRYDRAYFDRWYRRSSLKVGSRAALARKVGMTVALAEYYLGRPLRSVLDVGCGEGAWFPVLKSLRPRVSYLGLDSSDYAVARYGRSRNIRHAGFGQLGELRLDITFDLIVCSDVLHYVPTRELRRGIAGFAEICDGVAFIETFTAHDALNGDKRGFIARAPAWYRKEFRSAGLVACGTHCYLSPRLQASVAALEVLALG